MKISFLGQGFEDKSENAVGNYLINFLNQKDFIAFTGISAFASEAGIFGLSEHLKSARNYFQSVSLIVGVDQDGTSKEALEEILELNINSYIYYQKEPPIFHPKIYLFEGNHMIKLILGSSNLTARGLFTNVESSLLIEFDINDQEGMTLLSELKSYYSTLFDFTDPNLFRISNEIISQFILKGIVPDEIIRQQNYRKKSIGNTAEIESSINIPRRTTSRIPSSFANKRRSTRRSVESQIQLLSDESSSQELRSVEEGVEEFETLLWKSGPLTKRDLNVPTGANTNSTGSMLFKKGQSDWIEDQRHYFRDTAFSSLPWAPDPRPNISHLERATAFFRIIVMGRDHGIYSLALTHNVRRDTTSYLQKNSMTSLSWGDAKAIIAKNELIGKSAFLYKGPNQNSYKLVIQ